jgi:hypothetical protein
MKKLHVLLLVFLAMFLASNVSANPLPFLEKKDLGKLSPPEIFRALYALTDDNPRKKGFFTEMQKNLGLTDRQFSDIVNEPDRVRVIEWKSGMPLLITAGMLPPGMTVSYWRSVRMSEKVVLFSINGKWYPAFLLRCANPVRLVSKKNKEGDTQTVLAERPTGCWSTRKPIIEKDVFSYGFDDENNPAYTVFNEAQYGYYFPKACITDKDWERLNATMKGVEK